MLDFSLGRDGHLKSVLLLGAHCDDIEIGCGGTVLRLVEQNPQAEYLWVTFSSSHERAAETRNAAAALMAGAARTTVRVEAFPESLLPSAIVEIKRYFEELKASISPGLIFTHYRHDLHQDHRLINELTWNTFRNHAILEYEIPKFDGDLGVPNVFVPLTKARLARKIDLLLTSFPSQHSRSWFTRSTFEAIARLRGIECNAPDGFAEAFYGRKLALDF